MESLTSSVLRDYIEGNLGLVGEAMKNARLKREHQREIDKRVKKIQAKTGEIKAIRGSLAVTYKNFQQIDKDLKILARAMAAHIGLEDEDSKIQKQRDDLTGRKKKGLLLQQQAAKDNDDLNNIFDPWFRRFRKGPKRGKKGARGKAKRGKAKLPKRVPRIPRAPRPTKPGQQQGRKGPKRVPQYTPAQIEQRARTASRTAYNRAIAQGATPEQARARAQARYNSTRNSLITRQQGTVEPRANEPDRLRRETAALEAEQKRAAAALEAEQKRAAEIQERVRAQQAALQEERAKLALDAEEYKKQTAQLEQQRASLQKQIADLERKRAGAALALETVAADAERSRAKIVQLQADAANIEQERIKASRAAYDQITAAMQRETAEVYDKWKNYNKIADELGRPRLSIDYLASQKEINLPVYQAMRDSARARIQAEFDKKRAPVDAALAAEREALAKQAQMYQIISNNVTQAEIQQNAVRNQVADVVQRQSANAQALTNVPDREAALKARELALAGSERYAAELAQQAPRAPVVAPTPTPPATTAPPVKAPPPPTKVVHVPLNANARAAANAFAKNAIVKALGRKVYEKLPIIGIAIVAGVAVWYLAQGRVAKATVSVAEGLDPTFVGVMALTYLPQLKNDLYYEIHKVEYLVDIGIVGKEVADQRWKEVSDIVDEQWAQTKKELADTWDNTKASLKEKWRQDLDKGLWNVIRESFNAQPTEGREYDRLGRRRGKGRNVMPAENAAQVTAESLTGQPIPVAVAIRAASKLIGVEESLMLAIARQESGFNPSAVNKTSATPGAAGLFQFIPDTWKSVTEKHPEYADIFARGILDPLANSIAGAIFLKQNIDQLKSSGLEVNHRNLYAAHFFGAAGARLMLQANPNRLANEVLPNAAASNLHTFYIRGDTSQPRTVGQVLALLQMQVGDYAPQFARELQQGRTGEEIIARTLSVANSKREGQQGKSAPVVLPSNSTTFVPVPTGRPAVRNESIPMVGM